MIVKQKVNLVHLIIIILSKKIKVINLYKNHYRINFMVIMILVQMKIRVICRKSILGLIKLFNLIMVKIKIILIIMF